MIAEWRRRARLTPVTALHCAGPANRPSVFQQLQKLKAENEKLKAENRALTRVVSKLTNAAAGGAAHK